MTRVLIDTNVLISYLLNPMGDGPPATLLRAAIAGRVTPVVSPRLIQEVKQKVSVKPYLRNRIPGDHTDSLARALITIGESHDDAEILYPAITRDSKDDYLVTNAVVYQADYLVSGDQDLLELGEFEGVRIVSPAEFVRILDES